jgi:crossover junction endodeoxyribonuclease RusA
MGHFTGQRLYLSNALDVVQTLEFRQQLARLDKFRAQMVGLAPRVVQQFVFHLHKVRSFNASTYGTKYRPVNSRLGLVSKKERYINGIEGARMIRLEFPWPPKQLLPNARGHWAARHKFTKSARTLGWGLTLTEITKGAKLPSDGDIVLSYEFTPPAGRGRPRDEDAVMSGCKAYRDGIADALNVNDSRFRNERPEWKPKDGAGKVVITIA